MFIRTLFLSLSVLLISQAATAQSSGTNQTVQTTVPFLTIAPDSRAAGMGDAGVATEADINSQHWNASKYVFMEQQAGIALSYTPWLRNLNVNDLNLLYLSGYYKFDRQQSISGSLRYFNLGEIIETDNTGSPTGNKIRPHEYAVDLGYSRLFGRYFSAGLVFRYIHSDIANGSSNLDNGIGYKDDYEPGNSFATDLSVFYEKPINVSGYESKYALGLNLSNVGTKMSYSDESASQPIPTNLRLGGRYEMEIDEYNAFAATLDLNRLLVPLNDTNAGVIEGIFISLTDTPGGLAEGLQRIQWSFGFEYWYMKQFAIRAGYFHEHENYGNRKYYTAGVGLALNVFSLDFSYLIPAQGGRNSPLANTMRFTLGFRFE
jgi:hypothetical protein